MKKLAVVLLISFMAVSAGAANWVAVVEDSAKGIYTYIDTESLSTQGNYKQLFVKMIDIPKGFSVISLTFYDCKSNPRRWKTTHNTQFDLEGNATGSITKNSPFYPVLPESIAEAHTNMICNL